MPLPDNPLTRTEQYLSNIAGEQTQIPEKPITRIEQYLDYIAKNGGGGGGGGGGDMEKATYDTNNNGIVDNSEKVNNHTVNADVPTNAVFTDTVYDDAEIRSRIQELQTQIDTLRVITGAKIYGAKWTKASHQMSRLFDASGITTDVTNFCHRGTINANLDNPFDNIYPWSELKQCNVDLDVYRSLQPGDDIRDCVVSWFGDPDFVTDGSNGFVGRYTPEFWYKSYDVEDGRVFCVSDKKLEGWLHHKPSIRGIGFAVDDGTGQTVTSTDGQPLTNISVQTIHSRATATGITIESVYEYDANAILAIVEYASYDMQRMIGDGCSSNYYAPDFQLTEAETGATSVLLPKAGEQHYKPGCTLDFGTSKDGVVIENRREIVSSQTETDYCRVTFDKPLNTTTSMYPSVHGRKNDSGIGNDSGYIGVGGKANAFYRGSVLWGNRYHYVLGIARETGTNLVWLCPEESCDNYDGLNKSAFVDTGVKTPTTDSNAWKNVGDMDYPDGLAAFGVIKTYAAITGDSQYVVKADTGNTTPFFGGAANRGGNCGVVYALWYDSPGHSHWYSSAAPLLRQP